MQVCWADSGGGGRRKAIVGVQVAAVVQQDVVIVRNGRPEQSDGCSMMGRNNSQDVRCKG